jgi:hypothetical protein
MKYVQSPFALAPIAVALAACGTPDADHGATADSDIRTQEDASVSAAPAASSTSSADALSPTEEPPDVDPHAPTQRSPRRFDTTPDAGDRLNEQEPIVEPLDADAGALDPNDEDAGPARENTVPEEVEENDTEADRAAEDDSEAADEAPDGGPDPTVPAAGEPTSSKADEAAEIAELRTALSANAGDDPYSCVKQQIVSAAECGTDTVRDGALCGTHVVSDAAQCGTHAVSDAAQCGTQVVTDATQCGVTHVTSGALCGTAVITDGATCGWDWLSGLFSSGSPKSCSVDLDCDVPATCEVAASCEIASECEIASDCTVPKSCEIERCSQSKPGGACVPGLAECDTAGFSCQFSADQDVFRCLPDYASDLDVADKAVCEPLFDSGLSAMAQSGKVTLSFSTSTAAGAGAVGAYEVGTVYDSGGEFGCYISTCIGAQTDVSIAQAANFGAFTSWTNFAGNSKSVSVGGSLPIAELGVSSASVLSSDYGQYLGQIDSISVGVGIVPVALGYLSCNTTVYQVK